MQMRCHNISSPPLTNHLPASLRPGGYCIGHQALSVINCFYERKSIFVSILVNEIYTTFFLETGATNSTASKISNRYIVRRLHIFI